MTLDEAKKLAQAGLPVNSTGMNQGLDALQTLKQSVLDGKLNVTDFQDLNSKLVKSAQQVVQTVASQGSKAANTVNPQWSQMQSQGFVTIKGGQWAPQLPFSNQEYAKLPNSVLPSQADITSGSFDPTTAPIQRFKQDPTPAVNPGPGGTAPTGGNNAVNPSTGIPVTPAIGPDGKPLAAINPTLPPGTNTQTSQGQASLQGAQNAAQLQDALAKQYGVNTQAVQQLAQSMGQIPGIYRQEGQNQQNQLNQLATQQQSERQQSLSDLAGVLSQNQQNLFNRSIPDLAEQANTQGIYRSTGFGNILAQKYANLTQDTQTQLALQGLSDRNAYLQAQSGALNTGLGYSGQAAQAAATGAQTTGAASAGALQAYGAGLGDVANSQIGMQNAGLQRQFSLQDYSTQYANALNLANQMKTQGPTGKASPGTQAAIQTGLGVAQIGTQAAAIGK